MDAYDMSGYDKARKPYKPIDTSSPAGNWIEEKRYNKSRPTAATATAGSAPNSSTSRKVLCGNWQEEAALEGDLLRDEAEHLQSTTHSNGNGMASTLGASLDVIREGPNGRYTGGFTSSPYLTTDVANPNQRHLQSTSRAEYNAQSSDVKALVRPDLGVRSQLLLQQALAAAEEEQKRARAETAERQAQQAERTILRGQASASAAATTAALANPATVYTDSVYKTTMSNMRAHESTSWDRETVDGLRQDYLSDEAITLYTGNPETGKTMTVHGKTPRDPMGASRFGTHTQFSESKYQL